MPAERVDGWVPQDEGGPLVAERRVRRELQVHVLAAGPQERSRAALAHELRVAVERARQLAQVVTAAEGVRPGGVVDALALLRDQLADALRVVPGVGRRLV